MEPVVNVDAYRDQKRQGDRRHDFSGNLPDLFRFFGQMQTILHPSSDPFAPQQDMQQQIDGSRFQHRGKNAVQEVRPETAAHALHRGHQGEQQSCETGIESLRIPRGQHKKKRCQQKAEH